MIEVCYYVAEDGKKFEDRWDCIEYERRVNLEKHKDDFVFLDYRKNIIPIEQATTEKVMYIIVKNAKCAEAIGEWFESDSCQNPFNEFCDGFCYEIEGTWVYGDIIKEGSDEWLKLEFEIEKLQTLHKEINRER